MDNGGERNIFSIQYISATANSIGSTVLRYDNIQLILNYPFFNAIWRFAHRFQLDNGKKLNNYQSPTATVNSIGSTLI